MIDTKSTEPLVIELNIIDYNQDPWLVSDSAVPIAGVWSNGITAKFDPTVQIGPYSTAELTNPRLEFTTIDGSLGEVEIDTASGSIKLLPMMMLNIEITLEAA